MGVLTPIKHFEVLIRGLGDNGELISPGRFLPVAEQYGLMPDLDRWVIQAALAHPLTREAHVSINLSAQTLADASYLEALEAQLRDSGLAGHLCFEVTESAAMTSMATAKAFIAQLHALGCRVALDDFGSGFSSFAYLKELNVDYLKIDGSLIRQVHQSTQDKALTQAIVQMSQALGLKTVAEFVETPEQMAALRELGVDYVQGYLLHKPEPLDQCKPV